MRRELGVLCAALLAVPALWHVGVLGWLFAKRWDYPADIEWIEGNMLYEAHRLLHGQAVFGPPADYMPNHYAPGHAATLALLGCVFRLDYPLGRLLSIGSFLVGCGVLARTVWRHWEGFRFRFLPALMAVGFACAAYPVIRQWYDLVRIDSLAIAVICLAAILATEGALTTRRVVATALLLVYALFVKQTNVFFAVWIIGFTLLRDRRHGVLLLIATAAIGGIAVLALMATTRGWYGYWTFKLPARQPQDYGHAIEGLGTMIRFSPLLLAPPLLFAFLKGRRSLSRRGAFWFGMSLSAVPAGLLPLAKAGGSENNFIPMLFPLGAVVLILAHDFVAGRDLGKWSVCALGAAFLVWQTYDFRGYAPSPAQRAKAQMMNAEIAGFDGPVVVPSSPFLPARNGKDWPQFTSMSYLDMSWAKLEVDADRFLHDNGARWVILNTQAPENAIERLVIEQYDYEGELGAQVDAWATVRTGPRYVYRRRR